MAPVWSSFRSESVQRLYPVADPAQFLINEAHLAAVDGDIQVLLGHPDFCNITVESPLNIGKDDMASHIAPFDPSDFAQALESRGVYACGGNVLWGNPFFSVMPGVPINTRGVLYCKDFHFRPDRLRQPYPGPVSIAVFNNDPQDFLDNVGFHRCLSPEEAMHAFIRRIRHAIDNEKSGDLKLLKQMCLSAVVEIRLFKDRPSDLVKAASNIREKIGADYETLYHTPLQTVFKLAQFLKDLPAGMSADAMASEYNDGIVTTSGEQVTPELIRAVQMSWDILVSCPQLQQDLLAMEKRFGKKSPISSIYILRALIEFGNGDAEVMKWLVSSMIDAVVHHKVAPGELSERALKGRNESGGVGLFAVMHFKRLLPQPQPP